MQKNKRGQLNTAGIVGILVVVIVGIVMLAISYRTVDTATTNLYANATDSGEMFDANNQIQLSHTGLAASSHVTIVNYTADVGTYILPATNYTVNYNTGVITNNTAMNDSFTVLNATYTYYQDTAIQSGLTRTVIVFLPVMFAVAIILFVVGKGLMGKKWEN